MATFHLQYTHTPFGVFNSIRVERISNLSQTGMSNIIIFTTSDEFMTLQMTNMADFTHTYKLFGLDTGVRYRRDTKELLNYEDSEKRRLGNHTLGVHVAQ